MLFYRKTVLVLLALLMAASARGETLDIAEIHQQRLQLDGEQVRVHGEVVKVNYDIMGKNFVHLEDRSGPEELDHLIVVTEDRARLGETVTVVGIVQVDTDYGSGYFYPTLLVDAALIPAPHPIRE